MTPAQIQTLIDTNLADNSNITPAEHRAVETELLNYIKANVPLAKGTFHIGDIGTDAWYTVTFPSVGTTGYYVMGSLRSLGTNYSNDNDLFWVWRDPTASSFVVALREVSGNLQNVDFYWEIKAL